MLTAANIFKNKKKKEKGISPLAEVPNWFQFVKCTVLPDLKSEVARMLIKFLEIR